MTHLRPYGARALAGCSWGTGFFFGKIALADLVVPHVILYRLMFACSGFLPVAFARGLVHRREDWLTLSIAAAFGDDEQVGRVDPVRPEPSRYPVIHVLNYGLFGVSVPGRLGPLPVRS
jgi:hypothetical protein